MYQVFEHTADLGVRVEAATLAELYADAAAGLFAVIAGDLGQVRPAETERFTVPGSDPTWLLYDFLGELHAAFELRRMLFREFRVTITDDGLEATACGERYDPARHALAHEVKAITQHELAVDRSPERCTATYIVDI
ncbi:MAG: archease [Planctomycetota bacterium]